MLKNNIVFDKGHLYTLCKYNQTAMVKYIFSEPHRIYHMTRYIATEGINNHSWVSERNNKHPVNCVCQNGNIELFKIGLIKKIITETKRELINLINSLPTNPVPPVIATSFGFLYFKSMGYLVT